MTKLTFKLDVQLDDEENWIPAGTVVQIADVWKQHEGSTPVIITEALTYQDKPIKFHPHVEYFMNCSFQELI